MSNPLSFSWVKNVYNLRTLRGITSGRSYTVMVKEVLGASQVGVKVRSLHTFFPTLSSVSSPAFFRDFNLLFSQLYPVSTAPTIMKNKKK